MFNASGSRSQAWIRSWAPCSSAARRARPSAAAQQFVRLPFGERVESDREGAVNRGKFRKLISAGHQHQAAGRAGQQPSHLLGVPGVVQQYQHAPASRVR